MSLLLNLMVASIINCKQEISETIWGKGLCPSLYGTGSLALCLLADANRPHPNQEANLWFLCEKKEERSWAASKALNPALPAQSTAGCNAGWVAPISEAVAQPTWGFSPSSSQLWVRWPKTRTWTSDVWSIFLAEAYTWWSKKQPRDESDTKNCNLSTLFHKCAKERGHTKERKIQYMHSDLQ